MTMTRTAHVRIPAADWWPDDAVTSRELQAAFELREHRAVVQRMHRLGIEAQELAVKPLNYELTPTQAQAWLLDMVKTTREPIRRTTARKLLDSLPYQDEQAQANPAPYQLAPEHTQPDPTPEPVHPATPDPLVGKPTHTHQHDPATPSAHPMHPTDTHELSVVYHRANPVGWAVWATYHLLAPLARFLSSRVALLLVLCCVLLVQAHFVTRFVGHLLPGEGWGSTMLAHTFGYGWEIAGIALTLNGYTTKYLNTLAGVSGCIILIETLPTATDWVQVVRALLLAVACVGIVITFGEKYGSHAQH